MVSYGRWSLTRIKPQRVPTPPPPPLLLDKVWTHLQKRIHCMQFLTFTICVVSCCRKSSLHTLISELHTANKETKSCLKWSLTRGLKTVENFKTNIQKVVAITYKRWSFREGLKINAVI